MILSISQHSLLLLGLIPIFVLFVRGIILYLFMAYPNCFGYVNYLAYISMFVAGIPTESYNVGPPR